MTVDDSSGTRLATIIWPGSDPIKEPAIVTRDASPMMHVRCTELLEGCDADESAVLSNLYVISSLSAYHSVIRMF